MNPVQFFIQSNPASPVSAVADALGLSVRQARHAVQTLLAAGVVNRIIGPTRARRAGRRNVWLYSLSQRAPFVRPTAPAPRPVAKAAPKTPNLAQVLQRRYDHLLDVHGAVVARYTAAVAEIRALQAQLDPAEREEQIETFVMQRERAQKEARYYKGRSERAEADVHALKIEVRSLTELLETATDPGVRLRLVK